MTDKIQAALDLRASMQLYAQDKAAAGGGDETLMRMASLYPEWQAERSYAAGEVLKFGLTADGETQLWRVVTGHTSQAGWRPDTAPSLFSKIGFAEDGTPVWTQPGGARDAYSKGDIVEHGGVRWVSDVDGNVWEPGVYGWTEAQ